jgi:sugar lactone lactonase YvrE
MRPAWSSRWASSAHPPAGTFSPAECRFAAEFGTLKLVRPNGRERTIADLVAYEATANPDRGELESNLYSVALLRRGGALVADASGNYVATIGGDGKISTVAVFPNRDRVVPALSCPVPPGEELPPPGTIISSQEVPDSVAVGPDGAYYVGQLTGFPFTPRTANVFRIDPKTGAVSNYATGFTAIIDIAFGPDGSLYVLEMAREGLLEAFGCGKNEGRLVKVKHGHQKEIRVPGLSLPGGLDVDRDGTIYTSNKSIQPGGAGQVLKINLDD